jgi:exopolysaccharide production protein ExoY
MLLTGSGTGHGWTMIAAPRGDRGRLATVRRRLAGAAKRGGDLLVALVALVLLSPLLAIIPLAVLVDSSGPVIFRQTRVGRGGTRFACLKFRTMVPDAEARLERVLADDPDLRREYQQTWKLRHDPRVTRVGAVLRRASLDELPQLYNVVRGEMSLVGPRPLLPGELAWYGEALEDVLSVRPGLTGLWQVRGRGSSFSERISLDREYAGEVTFRRDLTIVVRTVGVVLLHRGAC